MSVPRFDKPKDPEDLSDFTFNFGDAMSAEDVVVAIDDVSILPANQGDAPEGDGLHVMLVAGLYSGQAVTLWLAGGRPGWRYEIGPLIRTAGGRTLRRRALLGVARL